MEQLEIGSCLEVEHPGKEPENGGADLGIHLHYQEFHQEPDLGYPRGWQHQSWEESESWEHLTGRHHSRQQ